VRRRQQPPLVEDSIKVYGVVPGSYAAGLYCNGMVAEAALQQTGGKTDDKEVLIKAMRGVALADSPRGPFRFERYLWEVRQGDFVFSGRPGDRSATWQS
jgi:ABC-type branched-subunit amino acid transport system substrate-binding protein